jgi:chorismate synthase
MIQEQLGRRKLGHGRGARQKIERDQVEILSGIRFGKTLGSPISLLIWNEDYSAWKDVMQTEPYEGPVRREVLVPRPGHADWVGGIKYHHRDMRNVLERASARETAMRVALGSVARCFLQNLGIFLASRVIRIGSISDEVALNLPIENLNQRVDLSPVRCCDSQAERAMVAEIDQMKREGNTLGGEFEVYASGIPIGLGSYAQADRRLEGNIAKALMSLNAIKGVEVGLGFRSAHMRGSEAHDEIFPGDFKSKVSFKTNRSGGIEGGISTSQPIVIRAAMKPLATLMNPLHSVHLETGEAQKAHVERSDVCAVPAAAVISESLLALVLTEAVLEKFGGDSMNEILFRIQEWKRVCSLS